MFWNFYGNISQCDLLDKIGKLKDTIVSGPKIGIESLSIMKTHLMIKYSSAPDYTAHIILFIYSLAQYQLLHDGHCGGSGWTPPHTNQSTVDDCLKECKSRDDVKFFAYVKDSGRCACYKTECLSDGKFMDHKAYEIVENGNNYL